jgi:putative N-acetylmannosamine-6-phosphate epimerase
MSKTKEYIDNLKEQGIDVLAIDDTVYTEYDAEYEEYLKKIYLESLEEMNKHFMEHPEETKKLEE